MNLSVYLNYLYILGRIKDIFKGPHRNFAIFVAVATGLFLLLWIVGPGNTVIHWGRAALDIRRQEREIKELEIQNAEMERQIRMLKTDRDTLEKFAREQFDFAVPGEDVYIIEESKNRYRSKE